MHGYGIPQAIVSLQSYSTAINALWTVYVVAVFAFAGFGLSAGDEFSPFIAAVLTLGFLCFTLGHASLVWQTIRAMKAIAAGIQNELAEASPATDDMGLAVKGHFRPALEAVCRTANPYRYSMTAHFVVDVTIVILIWSRVTSLW